MAIDTPPEEIEEDPYTFHINFPTGGLGYLTRFIYNGSIYPNVEFSVAAAITIISALCGRNWNTSTRSGLNTYNIVVAHSGMGKEEMSKAISKLTRLCQEKFPTFKDFFHFGNFASGQGLIKHFNPMRTSFAQILGEFGGLVKKFSNARDENMQGLMTVMLDLHSKSGPNSTSSSIIYSDATKNVLSVQSPSYSILGDTTPEIFESVNAFLLNNGFISRFNIFEYKGARSPMNDQTDHDIDPKFLDYLVLLARTSDHISTHKKGNIVATLTPEAQDRYNKFRRYCDNNYNHSIAVRSSDIEHHMWSRSLNRVNVLATLAAILDTPMSTQGIVVPPSVTETHWDYFERFVMNDINNFKTRQEDGDIGVGNSVQIKKLEKLLEEYVNRPVSLTYRIPAEFQASRKIPYSYIRQRMLQIACFRLDGNFDDKKLRDALQTLGKMGRIKEIKDPNEKGMTTGDLYWIRDA